MKKNRKVKHTNRTVIGKPRTRAQKKEKQKFLGRKCI